MILQGKRQIERSARSSVAEETTRLLEKDRLEIATVRLSSEERAELLDVEAWAPMLETFSRTMKVAVALTDVEGNLLGDCHNAQPIWSLVQDTIGRKRLGCPFCLAPSLACTAVVDTLRTGRPTFVRDQAGLSHVAVPLSLGDHPVGAIIAGQVSENYPESLLLQRAAKKLGVAAQLLWDLSSKQRPVSHAALEMAGDLLSTLGHAFLRQRYAAILETHMAQTNLRFRLLVECVTDYALFTTDHLGRITGWNVGAERMLGYSEVDILGRPFSCMFTSEDIQSGTPEKQLFKALQRGRSEDEGWRVRKNRAQFWANIIITPLAEETDSRRGYALVMQDVTDRRKAAIELENTRAERISLQEQFLSHVSHELRTPLTAIYFFVTNLLDGVVGELTPEQREHLEFSLENVKQLKEMVSDLLDVSRIESLKLAVSPRQTFLPNLIGEVLRTCLANAAAKKISLTYEIAQILPAAWADESRVRQVLINLIDNAIKFTPVDGSIVIRCSVYTEDSSFLCLSVSDTGSGISPADSLKVFDRLAQVRRSAEVSRKGLGLGLFISKELVLRQGGRIWVDSQLGDGSTFSLTLPVFSLKRFCQSIFTAENLAAGRVTLLSIQVPTADGAIQAQDQTEIWKILERCIVAGRDLLLPSMTDKETVDTFFIVSCVDNSCAEAITHGLHKQLDTSRWVPGISATTLQLSGESQSLEKRIAEVAARIDELIQAQSLKRDGSK